ncbi:MAG TPA: chromosomal replication initiator protein DnaA [Deltaproteobacteria bacterium]|nr:chromosomal replication initiator protein DnaA [Deltaproteobacteria bacterium]HOI07680.1 chromosomal replication initiator protein DnaA [Deltaproteobacteria bacterium]
MNSCELIRESILASVPGEADRALVEQIMIREEDGSVTILCPNSFSHTYLSRQYRELVIEGVRKALDREVDVRFGISADRTGITPAAEGRNPVQMSLPYAADPSPLLGLNRNYTFDEFIVGRCNAFAFEAAMAVSERDLNQYNPLYFYSDTGLGKSHIAHAIGNRMVGTKKAVKVRYTTARDFSQEFVNCVRNNCMDKFESAYSPSMLDVLFIDDVHLLKNKEKTQTELCHVMDDLIAAGKQVVLSGYRPPSSMTQVDKGLRSRFSSGLVIDIKRPDKGTREKIIRHKARKNGLVMPDDVVEFISSHVLGSVRDLDSAVLTIAAMSSLMKRSVTLDLAKELLEGTLQKQQEVTVEFIQNFVAKNFCITRETMISPSRKKDIVYPRQVAIFLCRRYTPDTLESIGGAFCRKHSSIIHSIETVEAMYKENLKVKREIDFLIEKLESETAR